jgi:predicted amidohydrolase
MTFTVGTAQFTPRKAQVPANLDRIAEFMEQGAQEGVDLMVFPETITSGYFLEGGVLESALTADELLRQIVRRSSPRMDVLIGFYERFEDNLYNSAAYIELGNEPRVVHVYRKFFLPTYGVFDEERFVARGHELGVFNTRLGRMGVLICEDVWHSILPSLCAVRGAQVMLVPSASPARGFQGESVGNLERYGRMLRSVSDEHGVYCVNAQLCGFEGGKGFVGGSSVVDPFGQVLVQAPLLEDHLAVAPVDLDQIAIARSQIPLTSDLQSAWADIQRIVAGDE